MPFCININDPKFKSLVDSVDHPPIEVEAAISLWRDQFGDYSAYPTVDTINRILDTSETNVERGLDIHTVPGTREYHNRYKELEGIVEGGQRKVDSFSAALDHVIDNEATTELPSFINTVNKLYHSLGDVNIDVDAFGQILEAVTSEADRMTLFPYAISINYEANINETLAEEFFYNTSADGTEFSPYKELEGGISDIFERIHTFISTTSKNSSYVSKLIADHFTKELMAVARQDMSRFKEGDYSNIEVSLEDRDAKIQELRDLFPRQTIIDKGTSTDWGRTTTLAVSKPEMTDYARYRHIKPLSLKQRVEFEENNKKYFGDINAESGSLKGALEVIATEGNPIAKLLLKHLNKDTSITILRNSDYIHRRSSLGDRQSRALGTFTSGVDRNKSITLARSGVKADTIIHEAIHYMVFDYIEAHPNSSEVKELKRLFKIAQGRESLQGEYGLTDFHEFMSEALSNEDFATKLQQEKIDGKEGKSFWRIIWEHISNFFGWGTDPNVTTNLRYAMIATGSHIMENAKNWLGEEGTVQAIKEQGYEVIVASMEGVTSPKSEVFQDKSTFMREALRNLNNNYTATELKEVVDYISGMYFDAVSEIQNEEGNEVFTREFIIESVGHPNLIEIVRKKIQEQLNQWEGIEGAEFLVNNLQKDLLHFEDLMLWASTQIASFEGFKLNRNDFALMHKVMGHETDKGDSTDADSQDTLEHSIKEGWMTNNMNTSVTAGLSSLVRRTLRGITRMSDDVDSEGNRVPMYNTRGIGHKIDDSTAVIDLLKILQKVHSSKDLFTELEKVVPQKPWVADVIEKLKEDSVFHTQFFHSMQTRHQPFWVTRMNIDAKGNVTYKSMETNRTDSVEPMIEEWTTHLENAMVLDTTTSIFINNGQISMDNIANNLLNISNRIREWNRLRDTLRKKTNPADREDYIRRNVPVLQSLLKGVGIGVSASDLNTLLIPDALREGPSTMYIMDSMLEYIKGINEWTQTHGKKNEGKIDGTKTIIESNSSNYRNLAEILSEVTDTHIEGASSQNGKNFWAFQKPSFLTMLVSRMNTLDWNSEEGKKWLYDNFQQYEGTLYDPINKEYSIQWLNDMFPTDPNLTSVANRNLFREKVDTHFNNKDYNKLSDVEHMLMLMVNYFHSKDNAWYHVPILAEAPVARFIHFKKHVGANYKTHIANMMARTVAMQEYNRINLVAKRAELFNEGKLKDTDLIKNFDSENRGQKFVFLPFLNEHLDTLHDLYNEGDNTKFYDEISKHIIEHFDEQAELSMQKVLDQGINIKQLESLRYGENSTLIGNKTENLKEAITEYYYNSAFATANIIQLTNTDLSFFGDITDFQKRNKQIHAPGNLLNLLAHYKGIRLGKDTETYIVLKDQYESTAMELAEMMYDGLSKNPNLPKERIDQIMSLYAPSKRVLQIDQYNKDLDTVLKHENDDVKSVVREVLKPYEQGNVFEIDDAQSVAINKSLREAGVGVALRGHILDIVKPLGKHNLTDAMAIRSLDSMISIIAMTEGMTDRVWESYQRLKKGEWSWEDYNIIMEARKPFTFTHVTKDSGVDRKDAEGNSLGNFKMKVPTQHKNSEIMLTQGMIDALGGSPKLQGLLDAMEGRRRNKDGGYIMENGKPKQFQKAIDVAMFDSAVKVGMQGVLDINHLEDASEISEFISEYVDDSNVYQELSYEDYRIQQPMSDHLTDKQSLIGTQLRAIVRENINPEGTYIVDGKEISGEDFRQLYDHTLLENLLEKYEELRNTFDDPEQLQEILQDEILSNTRYATDLINALGLDHNLEFLMPLFETSQSTRIEQLLNSIWKSRITKQKMKGGKVVNITSYGVHDTLSIVMAKDKNGNEYIDYVEAYLPFWGKEITPEMQRMMEENNGILLVDELLDQGIITEEMLEMVGYRIPTENKYSMWPIKVKGFLPRANGGNIILPREITTTAGLDFDIDSTYLLMKEFRNNIDWKQAHNDFMDLNKGEWRSKIRQEWKDRTKDTHKDNIQGEQEMLEALENMSLEDMDLENTEDHVKDVTGREIRESLGYNEEFNKWYAKQGNKYLTGFTHLETDVNADPKDMNRSQRNNLLVDMIRASLRTNDSLVHTLDPNNFDYLRATSRRLNILASNKQFKVPAGHSKWSYLESLSLDKLQELEKKLKLEDNMDMLDFTTQNVLFKKNMVAANLIGIIANHRSNSAIRQGLNMQVTHNVDIIDGKPHSFPRFKINGKFLTNLSSEMGPEGNYISSSYASSLAASVDAVKDPVLDGMNYNTHTADIAMLLTGLGYTENEIGLFLRQPAVMDIVKEIEINVLDKVSLDEAIKRVWERYAKDVDVLSLRDNDLRLETMATALSQRGEYNNLSDRQKHQYNEFQAAVILNFQNIANTANVLSSFVSATSAHTGTGGAGPRISNTFLNIQKVGNNMDNASKMYPVITNLDAIHPTTINADTDINQLRERLRSEKIGYVQAMTALGWYANMEAMSKYFPFQQPHFNDAFTYLENYSMDGRVSEGMINRLFSDWLTYYMSQYDGWDNGKDSSADYYINTFPKDYARIKAENLDIQDLDFLKHITVHNATNEIPVPTLRFNAGGSINPARRDNIMQEWRSLLTHDNAEVRKMAVDLFKYNFYTSGLAFTGISFAHLATVDVKMAVPGYVENLKRAMDVQVSEDAFQNFMDQFYRNQLDNTNLVPTFDLNDFDAKADPAELLEEGILTSDLIGGKDTFSRKGGIMPFVKIEAGNKDIDGYYKVNRTEVEEGVFKLTFDKTTPLGVKNTIRTYNYNDSFIESPIGNHALGYQGISNLNETAGEFHDNSVKSSEKVSGDNLITEGQSEISGDMRAKLREIARKAQKGESTKAPQTTKQKAWSIDTTINNVTKMKDGNMYWEGELKQEPKARVLSQSQRTEKISEEKAREGIRKVFQMAEDNPNTMIFVPYTNVSSRIDTGYTGEQMIAMFQEAGPIPGNLMFSKNWVLGGDIYQTSEKSLGGEGTSNAQTIMHNNISYEVSMVEGNGIITNTLTGRQISSSSSIGAAILQKVDWDSSDATYTESSPTDQLTQVREGLEAISKENPRITKAKQEIIRRTKQLKDSKNNYIFVGEKIFSGDWLRSEIIGFDVFYNPLVTTENNKLSYIESMPTLEIWFKDPSRGKKYKINYDGRNSGYQFENSFYTEYKKLMKDHYFKIDIKDLQEGLETTGKESAKPQVRLFDSKDKSLRKGSVVEYKGSKYLFWNQNDSGKAQLINTDGTKYSGTPNINKLKVLGGYQTTTYNGTEYIVTDNNNVYSGATGALVYQGNDNSSKMQKARIIEQAKISAEGFSETIAFPTTTQDSNLANDIAQLENLISEDKINEAREQC